MLEGKGGCIRNLYEPLALKFVGCNFLLCANGLPDIANQAIFPD